MTSRLAVAALAAFAFTAPVVAGEPAGHKSEWSYEGATGPSEWGRLKPEFGACAGRSNQSPIDIATTIDAVLPPLKTRYPAAGIEVINNGHTVQANFKPGSAVTIDGRAFELKQFHFHSPSENRISGKTYPLEAHLVHADTDGQLTVIAVFFAEGKPNPMVTAVWERIPKVGEKNDLPAPLSAAALLPANRDYYRFNGSLTTPPCSEGVRWIVMKQPMTVSKAQIEQFQKTLGFANNRPVQPVLARPVLR
jgi:carbonic anhydrase